MSVYLKVKLKSLAAESRIIRREESKAKAQGKPELYVGLRDHRLNVVRAEARATHLAYSFIRGRSFASIEAKSHLAPDWAKVEAMVKRYGPYTFTPKETVTKDVTAWRKARDAQPVAA